MRLVILTLVLLSLLTACGVQRPPKDANPYELIDSFVRDCSCVSIDFNHVAQLTSMSYHEMLAWAKLRGYIIYDDGGRLAVKGW